MSNQISCPSCNASNPMDAAFCNSCGKSLLQKCRFCNTANLISASFCKSCGIKLSDAIFGLPLETIEKFNDFCCQFPGYTEDYARHKPWLESKVKEVEERKAVIDHIDNYKSFGEQQIPFRFVYYLIANLDWQISKVVIDNKTEIKSGYITLSSYHFGIHDVVKKEYYRLFHERVHKVTRHDKVIRALYSDGHFMDLYPRVPGLNWTAMFLGGFSFLLNLATEDSTSDYQKSVQDQEARERSQASANERDWKEAYIQGWFNFLNTILSQKNAR